jgi:hypothetical protein
MIPTTSHPEFLASIVAAEMTEFIPGAGPPPHKIPSFTAPSFQQRGDPHNRVVWLLNAQLFRRHPEVMAGHAVHHHVLNGTVSAR